MRDTSDDRVLDEWMYSVSLALAVLDGDDTKDTAAALKTLDEMREQRTAISLRKHNETGYQSAIRCGKAFFAPASLRGWIRGCRRRAPGAGSARASRRSTSSSGPRMTLLDQTSSARASSYSGSVRGRAEYGPELEAREPAAEADIRSLAEGDVLTRIRPRDVEDVRSRPPLCLVPFAEAINHDVRAGWKGDRRGRLRARSFYACTVRSALAGSPRLRCRACPAGLEGAPTGHGIRAACRG